jgi:hypothetical protein
MSKQLRYHHRLLLKKPLERLAAPSQGLLLPPKEGKRTILTAYA